MTDQQINLRKTIFNQLSNTAKDLQYFKDPKVALKQKLNKMKLNRSKSKSSN